MSKSHFDLDTPPTDPCTAELEIPETPLITKPVTPKLITLPLGIKVSPLQAAVLCLTIVGIVIFGVLRNNTQDTGAPPQFVAQDLVSTPTTSSTAMATPESHPPQAPETMTLENPFTSSTHIIDSSIVTDATQQAIADNRVFSENNREGLRALDQRLRALERRVNAFEQYHSPAPPPAVVSAHTPSSPVKKTQRAGNRDNSLRGATVTSLYPGLAWVNYQGSTWALRPGDRIGQATVQSIDTQQRQVITTGGVIR